MRRRVKNASGGAGGGGWEGVREKGRKRGVFIRACNIF